MENREIAYVPMGESTEIRLNPAMVRQFLAVKTKSGKEPSDQDVVKFLMLCQTKQLNPWAGDAYLVGYDTKDGPTYSLLTSIWALFKRAEASGQFDGIESGIIIKSPEGIEERQGSLLLDGEALVGGWSRCRRKDVATPFYDSVSLKTYDTGRSQWAKDKPGMIQKVARAHALRQAFPTQLGGLHASEEMQFERPSKAPSRGSRVSVVETTEAGGKDINGAADLRDDEPPKPKRQRKAKPKPSGPAVPDQWVELNNALQLAGSVEEVNAIASRMVTTETAPSEEEFDAASLIVKFHEGRVQGTKQEELI